MATRRPPDIGKGQDPGLDLPGMGMGGGGNQAWAAPPAMPGIPGNPADPYSRNSQTPRERDPSMPPDVRRIGGGPPPMDLGGAPGAPNGPQATPGQPSVPTPAALAPQVFRPIPPPGGPAASSGSLFGKAGGLMGGGLGVPSALGNGAADSNNPSDLIAQLLRMIHGS